MIDTSLDEREGSLRELIVDAVLHSYTIIYFSQRHSWRRVLLLLGTLGWPAPGLVGMAGLAIALVRVTLLMEL